MPPRYRYPIPPDTPTPATCRPRDPALDGLRGLAVLLVFAFHYGGGLTASRPLIRALGHLTQAGWTGVVLFFALSGYLITQSLLRDLTHPQQQTHLLRRFYRNRALRILPLCALALSAALAAALILRAPAATLHTLAIYALFLQDLPKLAVQAMQHPSPLPLYHLWSLAVEEQFYLLWPVLLLTIWRWKPRYALSIALALTAVTIAFRVAVWSGSAATAFQYESFLLTHATAILLGAALALAPKASRATRTRFALPACLLGIALYLFVSHAAGTLDLAGPLQYIVGLPAVSLAAIALIALVQATTLPRSLFTCPPLPWLGRISYGFYVFHILLQPLFDQIARTLTHTASGFPYLIIRLIAALSLTLLAAWLSFRFFEQPFLRLQRHPLCTTPTAIH